MRICVIFLLLCGLNGQAIATETRVDSTGSIDMVLWDETTDLIPYNFGNPAGLALLPVGGQVSLTIPWFTISGTNYNASYFGLSPGAYQGFPSLIASTSGSYNTAGLQYQGLNYVTPDKWALQATGSYSDNQLPAPNFSDIGQGLIRIARDFGPLTVGTEFQYTGGSLNLFNGYTSTLTGPGELNTGILVNVPLGNSQHPCWFRFGGSVGFDLSPGQTQSVRGGNISDTSNMIIAPCVYLEIPDSLQAGIIVNTANAPTSISIVNGETYPFESYTNDVDLIFCKWKMVLSPPRDAQHLSLNGGILFEITNQAVNNLGDIYNSYTTQSSQLQIGLGLERVKNFTLGLQLDAQGEIVNQIELTNPSSNQLQLCLGMEKWLSPNWAIRGGLVYQYLPVGNDEYVPDNFDEPTAGQETAWVTTLGLGYAVKNLKIDAMAFLDPQSVNNIYPFGGPPYQTYTVFGLELSGEFLFDN